MGRNISPSLIKIRGAGRKWSSAGALQAVASMKGVRESKCGILSRDSSASFPASGVLELQRRHHTVQRLARRRGRQ